MKALNLSYFYMPVALIILGVFYIFRNQPKLQFQLVVIAAIIYVILALLHHLKDKSLTLEIIIEYILMAALVIIILQGQLL